MKLDAREQSFSGPYWVYDVPAACMRQRVIWVDTGVAEIGFYPEGCRPDSFGDMPIQVERRKKIDLVGRTFLLDPIEDSDAGDVVEDVLFNGVGFDEAVERVKA